MEVNLTDGQIKTTTQNSDLLSNHQGAQEDVTANIMEEEATMTETSVIFQDESTDCAICLCSLDDPNMGEVIELTTSCGHRWHLECLKQQLEHAKPNPGQRLVLTGCRCAKCGSVCSDHPALRHLTRKTDSLREKVDAVLKEQLTDDEKNSANALEEARRKYAIYLCSHCNEPYFGGTIECADTIDGEVPPNERLCVACCAPTSNQTRLQSHCHHPLEHRAFHKWKCRYCCNIATHICYGTVHFCRDCHDRNSERVQIVRRQQQQRLRSGSGRMTTATATTNNHNKPPSCLTPIPCHGGQACPYPKPLGMTHHQNGPSADCEQMYECACCQSNPGGSGNHHHHAFVEPPGSRNFIQNSSGQDGPPRSPIWQQLNPRTRWRVEDSDTPLNETITTNFVSNYEWCVMVQLVPLTRFVRDPSQVRVEISAKYMGRTDCPSSFRMEAAMLNSRRQIVTRQRTDTLTAPADFWERASLVFDPTPGAHTVAMTVFGKDQRFWAGNFGSKVSDCQVRILGEGPELEQLLLPEGIAHGNVQARGAGENTGAARAD